MVYEERCTVFTGDIQNIIISNIKSLNLGNGERNSWLNANVCGYLTNCLTKNFDI